MSPGKMKAMTGTKDFVKRRDTLGGLRAAGLRAAGAAGLTAGALTKAFKAAKERKPSGRLNLDDISRAMKEMKRSKPSKMKPNVGLIPYIGSKRQPLKPSKPIKRKKK